MEFTIYSIGSAAFLEEILNSVAMISGTGQIESLARIGLIVGVFILAFQAVMNNTGIQFQKVLVCLILYLAMYGPSGRALIEDVYTGDVAVVDNVPLGPLAVGSIVSNIGYVLTNTFEQAFSTPGMTNYGFADPLNTLIHVRKIASNVISLGSMTGAGGNESLMASWSNYMRECTLVAANNDERALHKMLNEHNAIDGLMFTSSVYYTKIFDGSAGGVVRTCTEAYSILKNITSSKEDDLLGDIGKGFTSTGTVLDSAAIEAKLNDALQFVAGGVVDARTFAVMAAVLPILEGAPSAKSIDDMQGAAAIMMSQAMQQQNTQWAAEGSMFTRYIRPFMTFFEGFIYAISPLMAFIIVLGGFGIGLVSKYLLILIWMVLWMPVLAIVNLYTLNQTQTKIEAITGGPFAGSGMSFNTMRDMLPILEQQVGVAGMLASSVPALCMFLVYGTSVAASGIASRLNGSDTINEKIASPDVVQPGPGLSMSSAFSTDPTMGTRSTGSESLRPTINTGSMLEKAASSAKENLTASSISYNQAFQKQLGQSISNGASKAEVAELGSGLTSALGLNKNSSFNSARQAALKLGATESDVDAFVAQVSAGGEASLGFSAFGNGVGVKSGTQTNSQGTQSSTNSVAREQQDAVSTELKSAIQSSFTKDNAQRTAERLQTSQDFKKDASFTDALSKQSADLQQSKESYSQVMSFKDSYGMQTRTSIDALAQDAINKGTAGKLNASLDNLNGKERDEALTKKDSFMRANATLMGNNNAEVAGTIYALASAGRYDMLGAALGSEYTPIDANANAGIGHVENNGNAGAYGGRGMPSPQFDPATERASIISRGEKNVKSLRNDGQEDVNSVYKNNVASMGNDRAEEVRMQWAEDGTNLTTSGIISNPTTSTGLLARAGGSDVVNEEKYRLGYHDALERNLPQPLAEIAGNASRGIVDDNHVRDTVIELQRNYGLSGAEAMGAVNATVAGAVSNSQDGGHQYASIAEVFNSQGSAEALTDRGFAPSNHLKSLNREGGHQSTNSDEAVSSAPLTDTNHAPTNQLSTTREDSAEAGNVAPLTDANHAPSNQFRSPTREDSAEAGNVAPLTDANHAPSNQFRSPTRENSAEAENAAPLTDANHAPSNQFRSPTREKPVEAENAAPLTDRNYAPSNHVHTLNREGVHQGTEHAEIVSAVPSTDWSHAPSNHLNAPNTSDGFQSSDSADLFNSQGSAEALPSWSHAPSNHQNVPNLVGSHQNTNSAETFNPQGSADALKDRSDTQPNLLKLTN